MPQNIIFGKKNETFLTSRKKWVLCHWRASGGGAVAPPPRISRMEHLELSQADKIFAEETSAYL